MEAPEDWLGLGLTTVPCSATEGCSRVRGLCICCLPAPAPPGSRSIPQAAVSLQAGCVITGGLVPGDCSRAGSSRSPGRLPGLLLPAPAPAADDRFTAGPPEGLSAFPSSCGSPLPGQLIFTSPSKCHFLGNDCNTPSSCSACPLLCLVCTSCLCRHPFTVRATARVSIPPPLIRLEAPWRQGACLFSSFPDSSPMPGALEATPKYLLDERRKGRKEERITDTPGNTRGAGNS